MRSLCRLLLVWLAVLAMPLQGMAAAAMLHCASAGVARDAQRVPHGHAADGHDHADGHAHAHHHQDATGDEAGGDPSPALASDAGHSCSACAACCAGAGLPAASLHLTLPELSSPPATLAVATTVSFIVSGPERPPRATLA